MPFYQLITISTFFVAITIYIETAYKVKGYTCTHYSVSIILSKQKSTARIMRGAFSNAQNME